MTSTQVRARGGQHRPDGLRIAYSVGPKAQDWGKHQLKLSSDSQPGFPSRAAARAASEHPGSIGVQMELKASRLS